MDTTFWMIIVIISFITGLRFNKTVLDIFLRIFFVGFAQMACESRFYKEYLAGIKIKNNESLMLKYMDERKDMFLLLQERARKEKGNDQWHKDTIKSEAGYYRYSLAILLLSDRHKIAEKHLGIDFLDVEE